MSRTDPARPAPAPAPPGGAVGSGGSVRPGGAVGSGGSVRPVESVGSATTRLLAELRRSLRDGGLHGSFLVRDLDSGEELGIDPDVELPVASLVKVPLALATLERIRLGELDGATAVEVAPGRITTPGPTGLSRFRHPARISVDDLLYLSTCISDGVAADALFALTPPSRVAAIVHGLGLRGISVRHTTRQLSETPEERFDRADAHLAHALAIDAGTAGRGHRVPQLDVSRANTGTARAYVDLLQAIWPASAEGADPSGGDPSGGVHPEVAARLRTLLADNVLRHRLAPDFASDAATWSSKTGTLLNLRHEAGVVEHADGRRYAVAALSESRVAAGTQPGVDALLGQVARRLRDRLRAGLV